MAPAAMIRVAARYSAVVVLGMPAACSHGTFAADVRPQPEAGRYAPVAPDSVRVVPAPDFSAGWQERLSDSVAAPYEKLASITATSAGSRAAEDAVASLRRRVAAIGGNAAVVLYVRKDPAGPYTRATGYALRVLPPMPDAPARCARLVDRDSSAARVVACREAVRRDPADIAPRKGLVLAHLGLAEAMRERSPGHLAHDASSDAAVAMQAAHALDSATATPTAWLPGLVPLSGGDSVRAYLTLTRTLGAAGFADGALMAAREVTRLAPDSPDGYQAAVSLLRRANRPIDALALAAVYVRRHPERVEGWAWAAVAAHDLGDHHRAMRFWGRVLELRPRYFGYGMTEPYGRSEHVRSMEVAGRQPPASLDDLPTG